MKQSKVKTSGSYPQWRDHVDQSYGASFSRLFIKLDQLLSNKFSDYVPGSFYNKCLVLLSGQIAGKKNIRLPDEIGMAMLKSLFYTCKEVPVTSNFLGQNPEISKVYTELKDMLTNVAVMIQLQDTFDELNKINIHTN
ncbi:MAG: hypothetical protein M1445_11625 [Bacteroidetes bacterium]|nr:hypothetical protein [Bacteroidota bacterium]MCL6101601.1 hypothetical protein [Bacteroidota bacterium]